MKKIPESFELTEEDITEAINLWLNEYHTDGNGEDFAVSFSVQEKTINFGGGMSDYATTKIISALATKL